MNINWWSNFVYKYCNNFLKLPRLCCLICPKVSKYVFSVSVSALLLYSEQNTFLVFMAKKPNSFVRFLGESMVRKSAYGFIWPLKSSHEIWPKTLTIWCKSKHYQCFASICAFYLWTKLSIMLWFALVQSFCWHAEKKSRRPRL